MRTGSASTANRRWFIVVFPAIHILKILSCAIPEALHSVFTSGFNVSSTIALWSFLRPPTFCCSIIRLMTSAPNRICPFPEEAFATIFPVSMSTSRADTVVVPISIASPPTCGTAPFGITSSTSTLSPALRMTHFRWKEDCLRASASFLSAANVIFTRSTWHCALTAHIRRSLSGIVSSRDGISIFTSITSRSFLNSIPASAMSDFVFSKMRTSSVELRSATFILLR